MNVRRTWSGTGRQFRAVVEAEHPSEGWLLRGYIRPVGVDDMVGAGLGGHLIWRLTSYDHVDLGQLTCDYRDAEKALLEATKELD